MKFNYQARTKQGDIQAGVVEAASQEAAIKVLQDYELVVTFLERSGEEPFYSKRLWIFERITEKDLVLFSRELATLFKAEVSLVEALRTLAEETKNLNFKDKILKIGEAVEGGTSLSEAFALFPDVFSPLYVNLIRSGEISGKLSPVLDYLADHVEREYALRQKLLVMTIYPAFVLLAFVAVFVLMALVVIPQLVTVLNYEPGQLPLLTKVVISITEFFRRFFLLIVLVLVAAGLGLRTYLKTPEGQKKFDGFLLRLPLIGEFLQRVYLARFAENLATLISGGLAIAKSLEVSSNVVGSPSYQDIILEAREDVRRGEKISVALRRHPDLMPVFFSQMVLIGERTGSLSETLLDVTGFYNKEIERGAEALLSILEPLMILVLGGLVGLLIAAVLLPLYQMGSGPTS